MDGQKRTRSIASLYLCTLDAGWGGGKKLKSFDEKMKREERATAMDLTIRPPPPSPSSDKKPNSDNDAAAGLLMMVMKMLLAHILEET